MPAALVDQCLSTLLSCFRDESWPVRDSACVACGAFVRGFPAQSERWIAELLPLWKSALEDNIQSVREGAAVALARSATVSSAVAQAAMTWLPGLLSAAHDQPNTEDEPSEGTAGPTPFGSGVLSGVVAGSVVSASGGGAGAGAGTGSPTAAAVTRSGTENAVMFSCGSLAPKMGAYSYRFISCCEFLRNPCCSLRK